MILFLTYDLQTVWRCNSSRSELCSYSTLKSLIARTVFCGDHHHHHHQSVLPKSRYLVANSGSKAAVLSKRRSSTAKSGTKIAVLLGMNRCSSFPLLSAPPSLFSFWTDLKKSETIPRAPAWRWGEWIWLTGPSRLHRKSPQGLSISSIRVLIRPEIRKSQSDFLWWYSS